MAVGADQMMVAMLRGCEQYGVTRIVRPHIFAFGGVLSTAKWLRQVQDGQFDIVEHDKFVIIFGAGVGIHQLDSQFRRVPAADAMRRQRAGEGAYERDLDRVLGVGCPDAEGQR